MRIGVIGLGVISRYYLAALGESGPLRLAAVCDVRPEALAPYRDEVPCWRDHRDMIAAGGLDGVVVTVPNDQHAPVCHDLLDAGLPVCVEKPLATRLRDGLAMAELAAARGAVLFTSFHRRYNARIRALLEGLPRGVPIESVTVRYLERIEEHVGADGWYLDPARCGGGCVADNGPNAFDLARLLLGSLQVSSVDIRRDAAGVDRAARVHLAAESGARARVELDWDHPGETKDVEVRLADGAVWRADMLAGFTGFKQSLWHEYAGVLRAFTLAVHTGGVDRDGLAALSLVDAAYRAEQWSRAALIGEK
ncbi:putative dehydrogenase [Actinokineospora auranticolor]|uniref:Putative dehydrogenase n=1 Tax=Actinokineospora auranticolor TaxID=155976 RepID=A0A2S6GFU4_9PSEU|nr:putative dehydrogenase [Actinokineospora auranticolor]